MKIRICLGGATGKVGRELALSISNADDLSLSYATSRRSASKQISSIIQTIQSDLVMSDSLSKEILKDTDVYIDYTHPQAVKKNVQTAVHAGVHVVIGTSGLTDKDYKDIDQWALKNSVGVFAAGNFSLTAALLQHFASISAKFIPHWEVLDYGSGTKPDAPSGTARELANTLSAVSVPELPLPISDVQGLKESRGATLNGMQVHALRLPGFYSSSEVIFGLPGERLSLRHDSMSSRPYIEGTLMAARKVQSFTGLKRGLSTILDF